MTTVLQLQDDWRHVATIELIDASMDLEHVLAGGQSRCRIEPNVHSPSGHSWFDVLVDFGTGGREAAHAAFAALSAMQKAADRFGEDPDIQTLYVDAVMNTMPWDYWQKDGTAKPETARVIETIERPTEN